MLVEAVFCKELDPVIALLSDVISGKEPEAVRLEKGVYEIGHFSGGYILDREWWLGDQRSFDAEYPVLGAIGPYGVCDTYDQILEQCPELKDDPARAFVIFLCKVSKDDQPSSGGWRWHKWGEYIGTHKPECEYLYDEPVVEAVFCYHIYEIINPASIAAARLEAA